MGNRPTVPPFSNQQLASNAAITGVAVKLFEQQQQHQLLAAAVAASAASAASQNQQIKQQQQQQQLFQQQQHQQQQQQQQRTSPLQQTLLSYASGLQSNLAMQNRAIPPNVPVANRTHFRPIHPQPMIPPISGTFPLQYSSFLQLFLRFFFFKAKLFINAWLIQQIKLPALTQFIHITCDLCIR